MNMRSMRSSSALWVCARRTASGSASSSSLHGHCRFGADQDTKRQPASYASTVLDVPSCSNWYNMLDRNFCHPGEHWHVSS